MLLRGVQEPPGTLQRWILTTPGSVWRSIWTPQGAQIRGPTRWVGGTRERGYNPPHTFGVAWRARSQFAITDSASLGAKSL